MTTISISTDRLELIACNLEMIQAEISDRNKFSQLLNATIPANWPPPLNDRDSQLFILKKCQENPDIVGWWSWYFVLNNQGQNQRIAIGNGGLKGEPTADGTVEIGYSIIPDYQNLGYGTEAVKALVNWSFQHPEVKRVMAETLPELKPSQRLLEKCNFVYIGEGSEAGVIKFELARKS